MSFYLKFDLFNKSTLDESFLNNIKNLKISCTTFGRNSLWIGDEEGIVYKFDQEFSSTMFIAYKKKVTHILQCKERDVLITVGIDDGNTDVVKVWNLMKWNKQSNPTLLRVINPMKTDTEFKITCLNVLNDLNSLVLGLGNGNIDLIYSDILLPKRTKRKLLDYLKDTVTNIEIDQINNLLYIFATTAKKVMILAFNEQTDCTMVSLETDDVGSPLNCSLLIDQVFTLANHKGIYDFYVETVGPCRALDGEKINLYLYKNYLIVVKLIKPSILTGTSIVKRGDRKGALNYQIVIFDHLNKCIADEFSVPDYNFLFVEWNSIYVYCGEPTNKILVLTEKDLQSKLKIFIQKNSFALAIRIAKSQNFDADNLADMYRQYGDHLYKERNYEEAIDAYIKTIGKLEPSFVIGQFLNMSQIPYLTTYMEALMNRHEYKGEYVVLLFNCYIILKEQKKLCEFINNNKVLDFDIDKILNLLHKVQLYDEALQLAKRYNRPDWYLKIMIEDLKKYEESITYIETLPMKETEEALLTYGDTLINVEPEILADQLERVCDKQSDSNLSIATILKVFVNNRKGLKHFLQRYISKIVSNEENHSVYVDTLLELLLFEVEKETEENAKKSAEEVMQILTSENLKYHKSKALICCQNRGFTTGYRYLCELQKNYFEIMKSYYLEKDCEGILNTCSRFGTDVSELWIKAFEYFIKINAEKKKEKKVEKKDEKKNEKKDEKDEEKKKKDEEKKKKDEEKKKEEDEKYIRNVINEIQSQGLISPLLLLEKMTDQSHSFDFGLIKDFIMSYYEKNEDLITFYQNEITNLKEETQKNIDTIRDIDSEIQVFQNLKCMVCTNALDIPSVHFLCRHSYHMRCFETYKHSNEECPHCAPNNDHILPEINQWQSDKLESQHTATHLSLEKLWCNVLNNARHPISIDPDQFISESLTKSLLSEESTKVEPKVHTSSITGSREINVPERTIPTKETMPPIQQPPTNRVSSSPKTKKKIIDAPVKKPLIEKQAVTSHSSPLMAKASKVTAVSNPFDNSNQSRVNSSKNPFEIIGTDITHVAAVESKNLGTNNPFDDMIENKDKYPEHLNPF